MEQVLAFAGNHPFMSILWVVLLVALVVTSLQSATSKTTVLTPQQATITVNRNNGVFVDIRSADKYRSGHITDSIHLTAERIQKNDLKPLEKHKSDPIVLVCNSGMTAKGVATQLIKAGYEQVSVLQGGITAWQGASFPLVKK